MKFETHLGKNSYSCATYPKQLCLLSEGNSVTSGIFAWLGLVTAFRYLTKFGIATQFIHELSVSEVCWFRHAFYQLQKCDCPTRLNSLPHASQHLHEGQNMLFVKAS